MDADRHRAAARIGHEAVIDLERPLPAVPAVAPLGQRTALSFKPARTEIVQDQPALLQMARRQLGLDRLLPRQQPVHRGIEIILIGIGQDRKSTRLNSSHANISYAVFCLKKKKTQFYI